MLTVGGSKIIILLIVRILFVRSEEETTTDLPVQPINTFILDVTEDIRIENKTIWSLSTLAFSDWFTNFTDLSSESLINTTYFSDHNVTLEEFSTAKGLWVAFFTPRAPDFGKPFPLIQLQASYPTPVLRDFRVTVHFYFGGTGVLRVYPNGLSGKYMDYCDDCDSQLEWDGPWRTFSIRTNAQFVLELQAINGTTGDFIIIDKVKAEELGPLPTTTSATTTTDPTASSTTTANSTNTESIISTTSHSPSTATTKSLSNSKLIPSKTEFCCVYLFIYFSSKICF